MVAKNVIKTMNEPSCYQFTLTQYEHQVSMKLYHRKIPTIGGSINNKITGDKLSMLCESMGIIRKLMNSQVNKKHQELILYYNF